MPSIKEFVASNTYRADSSGYNAFETLGRRVGGQYDQAGNDLRDIGRAQAAGISMLGRWPYNVIELEQRRAKAAAASSKSASGGGASILRGQGGGSSRRRPSGGGFGQMSEGAGAFGRMANSLVGGEGSVTESDRDGYSAQVLKERDRQDRLNYLSYEKYRENLANYNKWLTGEAQKATPYGVYPTSDNPSSPYSSPYASWGPSDTTDYTKEETDYTVKTGTDYGSPTVPGWDWTFGLGSLFGGSSSSEPVAEAPIEYNPRY